MARNHPRVGPGKGGTFLARAWLSAVFPAHGRGSLRRPQKRKPSLRDDPILRHFHLVHPAEREEELYQILRGTFL